MADSKLSALLSSSAPGSFYYGIDASNNSRKFADPGFYNVKNYGAVGDGLTDDASAIQATVDAAAGAAIPGGVVFFPPGIYKVDTAITFDHLSWAALRIVGSGGLSQFGGTIIKTSNFIWIFQTDHGPAGGQGGNIPIDSIEHITFWNAYDPGAHGTITSTEPAGGGFGCIYMTAGLSGTRYASCGFRLGSGGGICLYDVGFDSRIINCNFIGAYSDTFTHAEDSFGIILWRGSIESTTIQAIGYGVTVGEPYEGLFRLELMQIESCGCAILWGDIMIAAWDPYVAATFGPGPTSAAGNIRNIGCESNGYADPATDPNIGAVIRIRGGAILENVHVVNIQVDNRNAIWLFGATGIFNSVLVWYGGTAQFTVAAINIEICYGAQFNFCSARNVGTAWNLPTVTTWNAQPSDGVTFKWCNTDGAIAFADLPSSANFGAEMLCSNSSSATFGTIIGGTGATKVVARWDGANWVVA